MNGVEAPQEMTRGAGDDRQAGRRGARSATSKTGPRTAEMIGWLVAERGVEPHLKLIDKSERTDGALSRSDFAFDPLADGRPHA